MNQKTLRLLVFCLVMLISVAFVPAGGAFAQISTSTTNTSTTTTNNNSTTTDNNISTTTNNTATTTATTTNSMATTTYKVRIMQHLCNNINDLGQFQNIGTSTDSLIMFLEKEYACGASNLPGDSIPPGSISNPQTWFNFEVMSGDATSTKTVQGNSVFVSSVRCETDVNNDFNQNGSISSSTCVNASYYEIPVTATSSMVTVTQNQVPTGFHFGTVQFTPVAIMTNNDIESLISSSTATGTPPMWQFDLATDTDKILMLHAFAFKDVATSTPTTTPGGGNGTSTATTTPNMSEILSILQDLQTKVSNLLSQLALLITKINTMQNGSGGNSTTSPPIVDSVAKVRAGSSSAVIGDTNDFAGDHFGPFEQVVMSLDGQTIKTMNTDKEGNFGTGSIFMPLTIGYKTYVFTGQTSGKVASVTVAVLPIP